MTRQETCEDRIDEALKNTAHVFTRYMENPTVESWRVLRSERWVNVEGTVRPYQKRVQQWEYFTFDEGETPEELTKALTDSPGSVEWLEDFDLYEEGDDEQPPFHEYGLSLEYRDDPRCYEYLLSWGGPSDMIRFFPDGRIEYRFHDWFDGAGRMVTREPWAEWLYGMFQDWGVFEWPDVYEDETEEWA